MASATAINGTNFFSELAAQLRLKEGWEVETSPYGGDADFIVKNGNSDRRIFIEIKDAKEYGVLPIATILPIGKLVRNNNIMDRVILVSLSDISSLLYNKLQELKVLSLVKPSVDQVVKEVGLALAS